jgi:hypothetical protein
VRAKPDLKAERIGFLAQGEALECTGNVSSKTTEITLGGKKHNEPWIEVKRLSGDKQTGWVYAGGLSFKEISLSKIHYRAVIPYIEDPNSASEDFVYFSEDIKVKCLTNGILSGTIEGKRAAVYLNDFDNVITEFDVSSVVEGETAGYVLIEDGKRPKFINHNMPDSVLKEIFKYFGIKPL